MAASIHDTCREGDLEATRQLLASDRSLVDADDRHAWRPVFHAALGRHIDVVRLLIDSGADLSAHNGDVLHYAAEVPDNKAIVSLLLTYGALDAYVRPADDLSRQFLSALYSGNESRVAAMLDRHPQLATRVDGRGDSPIHHAARNGDTGIMQLLIDNGADVNEVNERGHTVLYCAGSHGHVDTVRLLLSNHADVEARFTHDKITLLEWLARYPDDQRFTPVTQLLIEHVSAG